MANHNNNNGNGNKVFGQWLQQQRKSLDLTQEELAMRIDISWETVRKIESGARGPSKQVADLLADALRISPEQRPAFRNFARTGAAAEHFLSMPEAVPEPSHVPNNLPAQRTTFIGRESLVASVCALLLRPAVRLLTLTGPAGIGKTRLSLQVAADMLEKFPGGVYFVQLAPVTDPDLVAPTIVQTLGIAQSSDRPAMQRLKEYLRDKQMLLVLDNFEQIVQAGPQVAQLLEACPKLKVLVSSRAVLHVYGEHEFPVQPMSLPNPARLSTPEVLEQYEAVELFVQRAEAVKPAFAITEENAPSVAEICCRLDGLPLAIELAAARSNILSPQAIVSRLGSRLKLLTVGAEDLPARQRTLRNAIAWSYDLLDDDEKTLFAHLGVFSGGCTVEAAEAVLGEAGAEVEILDGLASLAGKSLLVQQEGLGGEPRFSMLETIREYALEKLQECCDAEEVEKRHTAYFLQLAEAAEPKLTSAERAEWLAKLEADLDNMRAVFTRCQSRNGDVEAGLRLAGALGWFWYFRSYLTEGSGWLEKALSAAPASDEADGLMARAKTLNGLARLLAGMGRYNEARPWLEECVETCRQMDDKTELAFALVLLGLAAVRNGERAMIFLCEESVAIFEERGDKWGLAYALDAFADASSWIDNFDQMELLARRSLELYRELDDQVGMATELFSLGGLAQFAGSFPAAIQYYEEALQISSALGDRWNLALLTNALAQASHLQADRGRAKILYEQAIPMLRELGMHSRVAGALRFLGHLAYDDDDYERAVALTKESLTEARQSDQSTQSALALGALGGLAAVSGYAQQAAILFGAAHALNVEQPLQFAPLDHARYTDRLAMVREALGEEGFAAAWDDGRAMSIDEAVSYALAMPILGPAKL